ncbi:MAG: hypothetical protein JRF08_05195 [Deltaproteobacteria bacterium]|nr:hypothetical protein [Deltaproteobacteria bacterium]MBW2104724.1 hypothetical protein [Deltaproteobacteria bacterium]MBW2332849.1 hypothetical protein [Deltaproteobacteria bacterium]
MARSMNPKKNESDTYHEAVKVANATVEYAGLVSWSIISMGSISIMNGIFKIIEPVGRNAAEPFFAIKKKIRKAFGKKIFVGDYKIYVDEKIKGIEETIRKLEERLSFLEKRGVRISERDYQEKKKELDKERKKILSLIVEENKRLRELLKT